MTYSEMTYDVRGLRFAVVIPSTRLDYKRELLTTDEAIVREIRMLDACEVERLQDASLLPVEGQVTRVDHAVRRVMDGAR